MELVDKVAELILWISGWVILGMAVIEGSHLIKKIMKKISSINENRKRSRNDE